MGISIDYNVLQNEITKRKSYKLSDVKTQIKKVAFDVVRFTSDDDIGHLWQIVNGENGDEYIVAMYDDKVEKTASSASVDNDWKVVPDFQNKNLNVFYKNSPIKKICLANYKIPSEDAFMVSASISEKLCTDQSFLNSFIKEFTEAEKKLLANQGK